MNILEQCEKGEHSRTVCIKGSTVEVCRCDEQKGTF